MSVNDVIVIAAVVLAAASLGWWFFGPKPAAEAAEAGGAQEIRVRVRGGYTPSRIHARPGVPVRLVFDRQESGDCTSRVVFPDLGVSADLPAFTETAVELPAQPAGEYGFACGMNMIHGLLTVDGKAG
ncbi:MAG TPA: ATPase P, partial [Actinobacteria bacterium]|nr:ATPase P [Actinomycetota bacterium]